MKRRHLIITLFFLQFSFAQAQVNDKSQTYRKPLDLPLFLSGTFAEFRADHFHSGIDIRVGGVEGAAVYAIEDGFVSRVAVSPGGFGKAIYVDHPSTGQTSVYAHLQKFSSKIAKWVKQQQYVQEKFTVNLLPDKMMFPVKKGEVIGYAGNSGSSGGPHLHFEIRDAASQQILNPLTNGFSIKDFIRPSITRLAVFPEGDDSEVEGRIKPLYVEVQGWGTQHRLKDRKVVKASGEVSFGITAHDAQNDTPNINGYYSVALFVDSAQVFEWKADKFSFDETRYINSFIDYSFYNEHDSRIARTAIDPLNKLGLYDGVKNNGKIRIGSGDTLKVVYVVKDANGNESRLPFTLVGVGKSVEKMPAKADSAFSRVSAGKKFQMKSVTFTVDFPADAFYRDESIQLKSEKGKTGQLSDELTIGSANVPVHKNFNLSIKIANTEIPSGKLTVVHLDKGKKSAIGGDFSDGWITVSTRKMGRFTVMADTVNPAIQALNFKNQTKIDTLKVLKVSIKDDFSGIADIQPTLNGKWLLMDYDPKLNLLTYEVDEHLIIGKNVFTLKVTDKCGNRAVYEAVLNR